MNALVEGLEFSVHPLENLQVQGGVLGALFRIGLKGASRAAHGPDGRTEIREYAEACGDIHGRTKSGSLKNLGTDSGDAKNIRCYSQKIHLNQKLAHQSLTGLKLPDCRRYEHTKRRIQPPIQ